MSITVVNRYVNSEPDGINRIYIGRGSPLGNPFKIGAQASHDASVIMTRDDVMLAYEQWLWSQIRARNPVVIQALDDIAFKHLDGHDVKLVCFCKPAKCHGDLIKHVIEARIQSMTKGE